jgi:hypothetical protein
MNRFGRPFRLDLFVLAGAGSSFCDCCASSMVSVVHQFLARLNSGSRNLEHGGLR